jgi:hypothetical protein
MKGGERRDVGHGKNALRVRRVLEYSLRYLDDFVERLDWGRRPLIEFAPFVQFNYTQSFLAPYLTTKPDFRRRVSNFKFGPVDDVWWPEQGWVPYTRDRMAPVAFGDRVEASDLPPAAGKRL